MATPTTLPAAFVAGAILTADQQNNLRGAFRVLQVVSATTATNIQNNTNTPVDTGLTVTITPQSATSKILLIGGHNGLVKTFTNANSGIVIAVMRGATILNYSSRGNLYTNTAIYNSGSDSFFILDSPATTSATTYKTQFSNTQNADGVIVQANVGAGNPTSYITALEISA